MSSQFFLSMINAIHQNVQERQFLVIKSKDNISVLLDKYTFKIRAKVPYALALA